MSPLMFLFAADEPTGLHSFGVFMLFVLAFGCFAAILHFFVEVLPRLRKYEAEAKVLDEQRAKQKLLEEFEAQKRLSEAQTRLSQTFELPNNASITVNLPSESADEWAMADAMEQVVQEFRERSLNANDDPASEPVTTNASDEA